MDNLAFDEKPDGSQDVPDADQRENPVVPAGAETSAGDDVRRRPLQGDCRGENEGEGRVCAQPPRAAGVHANAAMWIDPAVRNTCLCDPVSGSVSFYDTHVGAGAGRHDHVMPQFPMVVPCRLWGLTRNETRVRRITRAMSARRTSCNRDRRKVRIGTSRRFLRCRARTLDPRRKWACLAQSKRTAPSVAIDNRTGISPSPSTRYQSEWSFSCLDSPAGRQRKRVLRNLPGNSTR